MGTKTFKLVGYFVDHPEKRHQYFDSFIPILKADNTYFIPIEGKEEETFVIKNILAITGDVDLGISQETIDEEMLNHAIFFLDEHQRRNISVGDNWIYILVSSDCTLIGTQYSLMTSGRLPKIHEIHPAQLNEYFKAGLVEI